MGNYISTQAPKVKDNDDELHVQDVLIDVGDHVTPWDIDQQKYTMVFHDSQYNDSIQVTANQLLLDSDDSYFDSSSEYESEYEMSTYEEREALLGEKEEEQKEPEYDFDFDNRPDIRYLLYLKKWIELDSRSGYTRDYILKRLEKDLYSKEEVTYHDFVINYADVERSSDIFPLAKTAYTICRSNFLSRQTMKLLSKK